MPDELPAESGEAAALQRDLADYLKREGQIKNPRIEAAFRAVPRHLFLPEVPLQEAYRDTAIVTKSAGGLGISSSSQPTMMAIMLQQLGLEPGQRVLEIGAGTGYNAALMAQIAGEAGAVVTVDIDCDLVERARRHLSTAGFDRVQVVCGDGGLGYAAAAPYDRIMLTVGAWDIAPTWIEQLATDGRLVLPLSIRGLQLSIAFGRAGEHLVSLSACNCGFIRMRGAFAGPGALVQLGPEPGLHLGIDNAAGVKAEAVYDWLAGPWQDRPAGVKATRREIIDGLILWLALRESGVCRLQADAGALKRDLVPVVQHSSPDGPRGTIGLLGDTGLCLLVRTAAETTAALPSSQEAPIDLSVRSFGANSALQQRFLDHITAWDAAGCPSSRGLRIRAYPLEANYIPTERELTFDKRWTRLVFDWNP